MSIVPRLCSGWLTQPTRASDWFISAQQSLSMLNLDRIDGPESQAEMVERQGVHPLL